MKKETLTFVCDNCGKEQGVKDSKYPYDKDWCYLYNFNTQIKGIEIDTGVSVNRIEQKDKHFCSAKCMLNFIANKLNGGK